MVSLFYSINICTTLFFLLQSFIAKIRFFPKQTQMFVTIPHSKVYYKIEHQSRKRRPNIYKYICIYTPHIYISDIPHIPRHMLFSYHSQLLVAFDLCLSRDLNNTPITDLLLIPDYTGCPEIKNTH